MQYKPKKKKLIQNDPEVNSMFAKLIALQGRMHPDTIKTLYSLKGSYGAGGLSEAQVRLVYVLYNQAMKG